MGCGIYIITNLINKKVYIGSSVRINTRLMSHKYMLRLNEHFNQYLQKSFNKYGENNFSFEVLELCDEYLLVSRENYYIEKYESNNLTKGYNLATVNEFRRNVHNNETKKKNSKLELIRNGNFNTFKCINVLTGNELVFDNLVDAANYLSENNFTKAKLRNIIMKISEVLRKIKVNNGHKNGAHRLTAYKHKWVIIT